MSSFYELKKKSLLRAVKRLSPSFYCFLFHSFIHLHSLFSDSCQHLLFFQFFFHLTHTHLDKCCCHYYSSYYILSKTCFSFPLWDLWDQTLWAVASMSACWKDSPASIMKYIYSLFSFYSIMTHLLY